MKNVILVLLLAIASTQLKAQQAAQVKPDVQLNGGLQNYFKPLPYPTPQALITQPKEDLLNGAAFNGNISNTATVYSAMPTVKAQSNDHMPVFAAGDPGTKYTMLVKKVDVIEPAKGQQQLP